MSAEVFRRLASFAAVAVLSASVTDAPANASADYPRSCRDATAVFDSARAYSKDATVGEWKADRFNTARNEYFQCIREAADSQDLGYAVVGAIDCNIFVAYYYLRIARFAQSSMKITTSERRRLFAWARIKSIEYLRSAKNIIDTANSHPDSIDTDSMARVDTRYETYKSYSAEAKYMTFAARPKALDSAVGVVKAKHAASARRVETAAAPRDASCEVRNADAQTVDAVPAQYPDTARQKGAVGTTKVRVTLNASGTVVDASIAKSAGSAELDDAALAAARASKFSPEIVNCVPQAGSYLFSSDFTGN